MPASAYAGMLDLRVSTMIIRGSRNQPRRNLWWNKKKQTNQWKAFIALGHWDLGFAIMVCESILVDTHSSIIPIFQMHPLRHKLFVHGLFAVRGWWGFKPELPSYRVHVLKDYAILPLHVRIFMRIGMILGSWNAVVSKIGTEFIIYCGRSILNK